MKRYSDVVITDNNEDEEMEKLAEENGYPIWHYLGFEEKLPHNKFYEQENEHGYAEWVCQKVLPNHSIDCVAPDVHNFMAYEFANGFMIFGERDSIY